jgi:hypothetical protein
LVRVQYEFGVADQKPTKDSTEVERGTNKFAYCRQKVFWDAITNLLLPASPATLQSIGCTWCMAGSFPSKASCEVSETLAGGGHPSLRANNIIYFSDCSGCSFSCTEEGTPVAFLISSDDQECARSKLSANPHRDMCRITKCAQCEESLPFCQQADILSGSIQPSTRP